MVITTIYKFKDATENMSLRDNIIVMADEAHRTQEGDLGRKSRAALPNAFYFGLTGTPVNRLDTNTFNAFGSKVEKADTFQDIHFKSTKDNATLPLHFEPRLIDVHVDQWIRPLRLTKMHP